MDLSTRMVITVTSSITTAPPPPAGGIEPYTYGHRVLYAYKSRYSDDLDGGSVICNECAALPVRLLRNMTAVGRNEADELLPVAVAGWCCCHCDLGARDR